MPGEAAPVIGSSTELGIAASPEGLVTLGIYALGAYVVYRIAGALAHKGGLT
jgi:hypothetical protein